MYACAHACVHVCMCVCWVPEVFVRAGLLRLAQDIRPEKSRRGNALGVLVCFPDATGKIESEFQT